MSPFTPSLKRVRTLGLPMTSLPLVLLLTTIATACSHWTGVSGGVLAFSPNFDLVRRWNCCSYSATDCLDSPIRRQTQRQPLTRRSSGLYMAQTVSQKEAQVAIDKVVAALRRDGTAKAELGNLVKATVVLGYGSPDAGSINVRFNAQFRKGGMGRSAMPLPFGLGQSDVAEGRGTMVGQVKASVDSKTGRVLQCSVFRDLGYGRTFNLKT